MPTEPHTGRLNFGDGQVAMDDGTVLAVAGSPTPCASALAQYAKWGETQPVTVTGTPGTVNNAPVLFVTSIQWAAAAPLDSFAATASAAATTPIPIPVPLPTPAAVIPPITPPPPPRPSTKKSKRKTTRSASKK